MARKNKNSNEEPAIRSSLPAGVLAFLALPGRALRAAWEKFRGSPRPFKIAAIYMLTVLTAVGLFVWRASSLRLQYPYNSMDGQPGQYEYLWGDEMPALQEPQPEPAGTADKPAETAHAGQLQPPVQPPAEPAQTAAPTLPGALWPVEGEVLYGFHDLIWGSLNPPIAQYRYSKGMAIKAATGAPVSAVWSGVVTRVTAVDYPYGAGVTVSHAGGMETYYGALHGVRISAGESVRQGQILGLVAPGSGGEPACLYLEIRENQRAVDPLIYLSGR